MTKILSLLLGLLFIISGREEDGFEIVLRPESDSLMTVTIRNAINLCAEKGGGTVRFTPGVYKSGTIELRDNITLVLEEGALIKGSDSYADYENDAFIFGKDLKDISVKGSGEIDGVNCFNPDGEEGFRGPHCLRLINCSNIELKDFTIRNSANWAVNCRYCSFGNVTNVTILGGHDGLHTRFCDNFTVKDCDFRTGDDAFAGNDNRDFHISGCLVNTSCNGFRLGCVNLKVEKCKLWGPGEYMHKIQKRNNMLTAFVHFSPKDQKPQLKSANWQVSDITVDNVDIFYMYNFNNGLWQTGQPASDIRFDNIKATGLLRAFYIDGRKDSLFSLTIKRSAFTFREGDEGPGPTFEGARLSSDKFFFATGFSQLKLDRVTFKKKDPGPVMVCENGRSVVMNKVKFPGTEGDLGVSLREILQKEEN
ncbi:MAG TPA: glycosyl hydrolase family 28 protein [Bacteroidales bacterium]|nr:glycosyl hydrolase family 28 protein [Bacteroidales bacterium]